MKSSEYWHDMQTEKSWQLLQKIKGKFPFILIGGWAVYLWTRAQKSKDIDIIVDIKTLAELRKIHDVRKNEFLRKYEIKTDEADIDIYVKFYSKFPVPPESIETTKIEGFAVAKPEALLALKQAAEAARKESGKGEKDRIDIMNMLLKCDIDFAKYASLLGKNKKEVLARLLSILNAFKEADYFGMSPREFKLAKQKLAENIRKAQ